ncbi:MULTISPECIES: DNA polymerase III subunit delta' [Methylosinus]|uniref:DNA polymerase III subunit delta n=1 Tax=Methylosinus trichosporium (strain ATCC 35070 / NCIMB 11131 / UNIQEM 75 / OB3b) TaxID=595536 RepID=A0A2D2CVG1_METT3|nr:MULTISPECIES: DNA polymerase III subunit delta' [Methylosinus]ATQ66685.1 DNA polymerase III subunit delta' [Methylosinus trichosporium OB3b]OBS53355.1 DNA polymerase III subunit delta' [Methylosinus sp. 3S-1]
MKDEIEGLPESDRFAEAPHPRETTGFFGHAEAERELLDAFRRGRLAQAVLIGGPEGIGKATLAWRFARFLVAHPDPTSPPAQTAASLELPPDSPVTRRIRALALPDVTLLRRSWNEKSKKHYTEIRIEDVRKLIHLFQQSSGAGGWRIAIVDSVDDLNRSSANALLKLIEEPPERSLFLLIAHRPGRVLPTIRSRCRKLTLAPLAENEIVAAVRALGAPWSERSEAELAAAAARAEGSVREALRLLDGDGVAFDSALRGMFARLPQVDWLAVHALADRLTGRDNESAYETFMTAVFRFLDRAVREKAGQGAGAASLVPYARAFERIDEAARDTEVYNFDKRGLILSIFADLEEAARAR